MALGVIGLAAALYPFAGRHKKPGPLFPPAPVAPVVVVAGLSTNGLDTPAPAGSDPLPIPEASTAVRPPLVAGADSWISSSLPVLLARARERDSWDELTAELAKQMLAHPAALLHGLLAASNLAEMQPVVVRLALEQCPADKARALAGQLRTEPLEKPARDAYVGALMAATVNTDPDAALAILGTFADEANIAQTAAGLIENLVSARGADGLDRLRAQASGTQEYPSMMSLGLAKYAATDPAAARRWAQDNIGANDAVLQKEALFSVAPALAVSGRSAELIQWSKSLPPGSLDEVAAAELDRIVSQYDPAFAGPSSQAGADPNGRGQAVSYPGKPPAPVTGDDTLHEPNMDTVPSGPP